MEGMNQESEAETVTIITVGGMEILQGDLEAKVELIGTTEPEDLVNIMVAVPAEVSEVMVSVGDYVNEGDVLFVMDTESVEDQVTQAEIAVTMAQVGVDNAKSGVTLTNLAYTMAQNNYDMQRESFDFSQDNLAKYETLLAEGVVSQMEYDQIKLQSSDKQLPILEDQLEQAKASLAQASLGVESAEASLRQAQEGLDSALKMLNDMTVTSPVSGFVTGSNISEKNFASNAQPAMVIQNMDVITVSASVTENLVPKLNAGDTVQVTVGALDGKTFEGTIDTLSTAANQMTMLFPMTVKVNNANHEIKPGMFATVDVVKAASRDTLYVPSEAVVLRDDLHYIYVMDGEDKAVRKAVTIGIDNGYFTEILTGAVAGDIIVTKGIGLIEDSSVIKMVRSDQ